MAQHFVAMNEQGWKTEPGWEATAQPQSKCALCYFWPEQMWPGGLWGTMSLG